MIKKIKKVKFTYMTHKVNVLQTDFDKENWWEMNTVKFSHIFSVSPAEQAAACVFTAYDISYRVCQYFKSPCSSNH